MRSRWRSSFRDFSTGRPRVAFCSTTRTETRARGPRVRFSLFSKGLFPWVIDSRNSPRRTDRRGLGDRMDQRKDAQGGDSCYSLALLNQWRVADFRPESLWTGEQHGPCSLAALSLSSDDNLPLMKNWKWSPRVVIWCGSTSATKERPGKSACCGSSDSIGLRCDISEASSSAVRNQRFCREVSDWTQGFATTSGKHFPDRQCVGSSARCARVSRGL